MQRPPRIHSLHHVPFEGLGFIEQWANTNNAPMSSTKLYVDTTLPSQEEFDWLIIMGGPMNIYEEETYPWLRPEKKFIRETIANNKVVVGICLGAQLLADVLGAKVYSNGEKEIGWYPVTFLPESMDSKLGEVFGGEGTVIHWHGDTFELPKGAKHLAKSIACKNQGFIYNERVLALQFHLETTPESLQALITNCGDELVDGPYIQSADQMQAKVDHFKTIHTTMGNLLTYLSKRFPNGC